MLDLTVTVHEFKFWQNRPLVVLCSKTANETFSHTLCPSPMTHPTAQHITLDPQNNRLYSIEKTKKDNKTLFSLWENSTGLILSPFVFVNNSAAVLKL